MARAIGRIGVSLRLGRMCRILALALEPVREPATRAVTRESQLPPETAGRSIASARVHARASRFAGEGRHLASKFGLRGLVALPVAM